MTFSLQKPETATPFRLSPDQKKDRLYCLLNRLCALPIFFKLISIKFSRHRCMMYQSYALFYATSSVKSTLQTDSLGHFFCFFKKVSKKFYNFSCYWSNFVLIYIYLCIIPLHDSNIIKGQSIRDRMTFSGKIRLPCNINKNAAYRHSPIEIFKSNIANRCLP